MNSNEIEKNNRDFCEKKGFCFADRGGNIFQSLRQVEIMLRTLSKSCDVIKFAKLFK